MNALAKLTLPLLTEELADPAARTAMESTRKSLGFVRNATMNRSALQTLTEKTARISGLIAMTFGIGGFGCVAAAQIAPTPNLPLSLSLDAMKEAIRACDAKGYKVTVSVVDPDGVIKVQARSDASPIHSSQFSFRKSYTIISMGPMFSVDSSSALVKAISASPQGLTNVQSGDTPLLFLPGVVLIKSGKTPIGAIGVSGAPSSFEDEACAQSGLAKIQDKLDVVGQ
jgi:uncharacterized protein GlcG (DUF336 family)